MGHMEKLAIRQKRVSPRFPVDWPIELEHGSGWTRDFSIYGMYLECNVVVKEGQKLRFTVNLPKDDDHAAQRMHCVGRAVRVERIGGVGWGVGLKVSKFQFSSAGTLSRLNYKRKDKH